MSRRNLLQSLLSQDILPSAYQRVDKITSTGNAYIDSGYSFASSNIRIYAKYKSVYNNGCLFGSQSDSSHRSGIYWLLNNSTELGFGIGGQGAGSSIGTIDKSIVNTVEYSCDSSTYNLVVSGTYLKQNASYTGSVITGYNIFICCNNYIGAVEYSSGFEIYEFRMWDDGVVVRNFIPCYRKSDNEVGLYDTINGVFYTNANSVGSFVAGSDI